MTSKASSRTAEGLRLHKVASVETMHSLGPIGIIQRIARDRHNDVHLNPNATYPTKAFLVTKHLD